MCGRFGLTTDPAVFARLLGIEARPPDDVTGYNIAPGASIAAIHRPRPQERPCYDRLFWGFIPSWDSRGRARINARLDKRATPFWRRAFGRRRGVIPADWWYEWQRLDTHRQPFALRPADGQPFFLAAVWSRPAALAADHRAAGQRCAAIITRPAVGAAAEIHHRMPLILDAAGARDWLDVDIPAADVATAQAHRDLTTWAVGTRLNRAGAHDDPALVEPIDPAR